MAGYLIADVTTATDPALWASDHYRAAKIMRQAAIETNTIVVEGVA